MNFIKKNFCFIFCFILSFFVYAKSGNSTQVIKAGHWVYDDLEAICMDCKTEFFFETQPMTIGEIKFYLKKIPYETLSKNGRYLFDRVMAFLNKNDDFLPEQELRLFGNIKANPELYYKSNPDIDWTFDYYVKDFALTIPLIIGFSDFVTIEPDFMIGKSQPFMNKPDNFTNVIVNPGQVEFLFPRFAYGAAGHTFENWGVDFHIGKEGLQIYNTQLGSIFYNRTFETDSYCTLNLYTQYLKYSMHVAQVDNTKFLYMHQIYLRPFKWIKINVVEGSLLNAPFELRYLNPFMLMHQFGSWTQYGHQLTENEAKYYQEGHFSAYFGLNFEVIPFSNFKIYGTYAQNEILDMGGSRSDEALSVPDSIGVQVGLQYNIALNNDFMLKNYLEGIYTSPYFYIKQSPEWSLYRDRGNMQVAEHTITWIGSPYGPDCLAVMLKSEIAGGRNWNAGISYTFSVHGENSAESLFSQKKTITNYVEKEIIKENGEKETVLVEEKEDIYSYYPHTQYILADEADDEAAKKAARDKGRNMWMSGVNEYKNQIKLYGTYNFTKNFSCYAQGAYTIQIKDTNIQHGIELACGVEYILFN